MAKTAKKVTDRELADQYIRDHAAYYNVVLHVPQQNSRVYFSTTDLSEAIKFAESVYDDPQLPRVRAAMVYAVDKNDHFALVGTTNRFERSFKADSIENK